MRTSWRGAAGEVKAGDERERPVFPFRGGACVDNRAP